MNNTDNLTYEIGKLNFNEFTNQYFFRYKSSKDRYYHTVILIGFNKSESESIRKDFIDTTSNLYNENYDFSSKTITKEILENFQSFNITKKGYKYE